MSQLLLSLSTKEEFSQIKAKTLLLVGEQEKIYNNLKSAGELVPKMQIEMIPNAHHVAAVANPERINQSLLQFFAETK